MNRTIFAGILSAVFSALLVSPASADTLELSGGGHLSGQTKTKGDFAIVKVDDQIQVAIPISRVKRTVTSSELSIYRKRAKEAGEDAEKHYQLAIWCGKNVPGNSRLYKQMHMRQAVEIDTDHSKARTWLGYTKQKGKWILTSKLMRDRGMIWQGGRWEVPEAMAISEGRASANVEAKKWIRDVNRLVKSVQSRNVKYAPGAMTALKAIDDPKAANAIALQLKNSRGNKSQSRELRQLWVKLLGRFRNRDSVEALVRAGIEEDDATIREQALEQLIKFGSGSAVATYVPDLRSNDNARVNRAARALSWFPPDSELAMTYVHALVTEHKKVEAPGPQTQVGFGDRGGSGLTYGQKPRVVSRKKTNPAVRALLREIEPDVDHGYDEQAWLEYFAQKRGLYDGDLRRDP